MRALYWHLRRLVRRPHRQVRVNFYTLRGGRTARPNHLASVYHCRQGGR